MNFTLWLSPFFFTALISFGKPIEISQKTNAFPEKYRIAFTQVMALGNTWQQVQMCNSNPRSFNFSTWPSFTATIDMEGYGGKVLEVANKDKNSYFLKMEANQWGKHSPMWYEIYLVKDSPIVIEIRVCEGKDPASLKCPKDDTYMEHRAVGALSIYKETCPDEPNDL